MFSSKPTTVDCDLVVPGIYQEHGNRTKIKREEMMHIKELWKHINNYEAKKLHNKSRTPVTQTLKGNGKQFKLAGNSSYRKEI